MQSDRLHRVLEHVTEVHSLCDVLGEDFIAIVNEVHPGLHETSDPGKPTSISDSTLATLAQVVATLAAEKAKRAAMVRRACFFLYIYIRAYARTAQPVANSVDVLCSALQLREAVLPLVELWELMDSSEEERRSFRKVAAVLNPDKLDALPSGVLSVATIKKVHTALISLSLSLLLPDSIGRSGSDV